MSMKFDGKKWKYVDSFSWFPDVHDVCPPSLEATVENMFVYYSGSGDNLVEVKQFIDDGILIESTDMFETTPLLSACEYGNFDIVEFLINNKANIHHVDKSNGRTCLHCACISGSVEVTKLLIVNGACINQQDDDGNTCLHYACRGDHVDIVQLLFEHDVIVDVFNEENETALIETCKRVFQEFIQEFAGKTKYIINLLIQNGADTEELKHRNYNNKEIQRYVDRLCAYKWLQKYQLNEDILTNQTLNLI